MVKFNVQKLRQSPHPCKQRLTQIKDFAFNFPYLSKKLSVQENFMFRLASVLYSLISTSLAGTLIIAVLVAGYGTLSPILIAAALGFVLAAPVSWVVARKIYN